MIRRTRVKKTEQVKVSFVLPAEDERLPASVVGDFNEWRTESHQFKLRRNGTYSAVVTLDPGNSYQFRYRSESGTWFDEDQADGTVPNRFGSANCVLVT